jgi:4,5-DOPA dioxygenase extradiol
MERMVKTQIPAENQDKAQFVYFSHGGGPLPLLGDPGHASMVKFMRDLPAMLRKPEAIVVISAHWEESITTVLSGKTPPMFYDYYGFPEEAYEVNYPAQGNPALALEIVDLLKGQGLAARPDSQRGFDHGLFIPLMLMYPEADIPAIQLSLIRRLDATAHIALGNALRALMQKNILVIGSGFSFHNMYAFSWQGTAKPDPKNDAFQDWLIDTITKTESQAEREQKLIQWESAPSARYCHPREEHLLPLHVCQGMANKPARVVFDDAILGKRAVAFLWV